MAEVTGLVKYSFKGFKCLLTLPNMPMYISDIFIASVIVRVLVVFVTAQVQGAVLMASGTLKGESSTGRDQYLCSKFFHIFWHHEIFPISSF